MRKFGLVLGGGGAKGAYEIGVWRALRELDMQPEVVTGTSIGALNGALVVQGEYERAVQLWRGVRYETVLSSVISDDLTTLEGTARVLKTALKEIVRDGGMDITPLEQLVRETVDEGRIRNSPTEFGMVTVALPSLKTVTLAKHEVPDGELADYLLASAAIYPAFRRRDIGGTQYIDGGFRNNLPIDLAIALGAQDILAVDLDAAGLVPRRQGRGADASITVLKSYWGLGNMLNFEQEQISANIELGYLETMKLYGRYEGFAYTFADGQNDEWQRSWMPQYERLLERIGMGGGDDMSPAERFAAWRIARLLEDAKRVGRPVEQPELRMLELAAEMLGVPYTEVYTVRAMARAILAAGAGETDITLADFGELLTNPTRATELAKKLSLMERWQVLSLVCRWLDGYIHGDGRGMSFALLAAAAPAEFAAACVLYIIKNSEPGDAV